MTGALIILAVTVLTGALLYVLQRFMPRRNAVDADVVTDDAVPTDTPADDRPEGCCGQHLTCEKDSLLAAVSKEIEYFEDEELDEYRGVAPEDYTDEQIEQFRDVLYTLRPEEVAAWGRSIQLRGISLPNAVKDELIMLAAEARGTLHAAELKEAGQ